MHPSVMLIAAWFCAGEQENSKNPTRITMARLANALGHCNQFERADQLFSQAMQQPAAPIGASPQAVADVSDAVLLTCRAVLSVRESHHALRAGGDGAAEAEGRATLTSVRELLERAIALTVAEHTEDYVTYPEEVLQSIEALVDTASGSMDGLTAQLTSADVGATGALRLFPSADGLPDASRRSIAAGSAAPPFYVLALRLRLENTAGFGGEDQSE